MKNYLLQIFERFLKPTNKIIVFHKQEVIGRYSTFREAVEAVAGDKPVNATGSYGYTFYQGEQCIGVI